MNLSQKNKIKYFRFSYLAILVLITISYFVFKNDNTYQLVPINSNENLLFDTYHEALPDNYSYSEASFQKDTLIFKYKLTTAQEEPFTGLFFTKKDSSSFDFSKFNSINLKFTTDNAKVIPITFTTFHQPSANKNSPYSNLPFTYVADVKNQNNLTIKLSDFDIPSWWLRYHQLKKDDVGEIDLKQINYFVIGSCQVIGAGNSDVMKITKITFFNDNQQLISVLLSIAFIGLLLIIFIEVSIKKKKVLVPIVHQELSNPKDITDELIIFIAKNYSNPELNLEIIEKALPIKTREISQILQAKYNLNFKNYLNFVRLNEVKRLLLETSLPVSEIAYQCGYNNISHFNRVFKSEIGKSPKQFREI